MLLSARESVGRELAETATGAGYRDLRIIPAGAGGDDELNRDAGHAVDRPFVVDTCADVNFALLLWPKFLGRTPLPTPKNGKASSEIYSTSMKQEGKSTPVKQIILVNRLKMTERSKLKLQSLQLLFINHHLCAINT